MAWMPIDLEWLINQWAVSMTAAALIYNYLFNRGNLGLLSACFAVVTIYCLGSFSLNWVDHLDYAGQLQYRYSSRLTLYFVGMIMLSFLTRRVGSSFVIWFVQANFFIAILFQLALHIDRNHISFYSILDVAFGGEIVKDEYWGLWDWYTNFLLASDVMLVSYFLIGEKVKDYLCSLSR